MMLEEYGKRAKAAARALACATTEEKNGALLKIAAAIEENAPAILTANADDLTNGRASGLSDALLDRLALNEARIAGIADSLRQVAQLPDPVGRVLEETTRPNGLRLRKIAVPIGVIAVIYEARPNVTADSAGLCLKSGNAVLLRGGKEAIRSNIALAQVMRAAEAFRTAQPVAPGQQKLYAYYLQAYTAALGGLVGTYAIKKTSEDGSRHWQPCEGVKAFSPIAAGYWYSHYDDFGAGRSFGFARRHLGNDLLGSLGTPITAVEGGTVEAMGWNRYGGWRVGIRSHDRKRYYYYAHLRKDTPFAPGLQVGNTVQAGDLIGFMGRTGYSDRENVNNIETVHLHFGLQLIFDESQKECDSEIWIDVYEIVRFLSRHRSTLVQDTQTGTWKRLYPYRDLDT